jgi:hypothetical protein
MTHNQILVEKYLDKYLVGILYYCGKHALLERSSKCLAFKVTEIVLMSAVVSRCDDARPSSRTKSP